MLQGRSVIVEDTDRRSYHSIFASSTVHHGDSAHRVECYLRAVYAFHAAKTVPLHGVCMPRLFARISGIFESEWMDKYERKAAQDSGYRIVSLAYPNGAKLLNK